MENSRNSGIGFFGLLQLIFIVLKIKNKEEIKNRKEK